MTIKEKRKHLERENAKWPRHLLAIPENQWPAVARDLQDKPINVWRSSRFFVQLFPEKDGAQRLSVNRTTITPGADEWEDGITWDELMEIKDQAGFAAYWAVEIYPPFFNVVNVANLRHLWLLPSAPSFSWKVG